MDNEEIINLLGRASNANVMNDRHFVQLLTRASKAYMISDQAAVLSDVDRIKSDSNVGFLVTLLHCASAAGHVDLMRGLIMRGADGNAKDLYGKNALMWAATKGHIHAVTQMLDRRADINARDVHGQNALIHAAMNNQLDCAVFLLSRGVNLFAKNNDGKNALDLYGTQPTNQPPLGAETKERHREVLRVTFRHQKWLARRSVMLVVTQNNFRPLAARRLEQELARASLDPAVEAEVPPPVVLNTPEKRRAYYMGQVLSNDGLLRLVVSFL